jgi:hypothetical protein
MNAIVYSLFGLWAAKGLIYPSEKTQINYTAYGIILAAALFASLLYWKSFNLNLTVLLDRIKVKGWWQEIDIFFKDIEKCELHSASYSKSCVVHLRKPAPPIFRFSSNLPLMVLEKDRTVIALSSFLSEKDCLNLKELFIQEADISISTISEDLPGLVGE